MPMRGEPLDIPKELLNKFTLNDDTDVLNILNERDGQLLSTIHFRTTCKDEGYEILEVYPVYHHGWDCDEWGAIGTKDGKKYRLETNHGSLRPELMPTVKDILMEKIRGRK